jgi:hypothetical protein
MPPAISESIKVKVIGMWLQGLSRDANAKANYISTGAVSNIVKEFEDRIGRDCRTFHIRPIQGMQESWHYTQPNCNILKT